MSYPFQRLLSDLRTRYPSPAGSGSGSAPAEAPEAAMSGPEDEAFERRMTDLPKELGLLLVGIGVAGLLLPGPVGSPFVIAGGLVLWPKGFNRVDHWFARKFPETHRGGVNQIDRYLDDLEHRYPGSTHQAIEVRA